jgi:addiction module HigA family antidote
MLIPVASSVVVAPPWAASSNYDDGASRNSSHPLGRAGTFPGNNAIRYYSVSADEMVNYQRGRQMTDPAQPDNVAIRPGEMLVEDFLTPLGVTQYRLARAIGVPPRRINEIVHGTRRISADTALRLSRYFGMSDGFWMNLQAHYDLEMAKDRLKATLEDIEPLSAVK